MLPTKQHMPSFARRDATPGDGHVVAPRAEPSRVAAPHAQHYHKKNGNHSQEGAIVPKMEERIFYFRFETKMRNKKNTKKQES